MSHDANIARFDQVVDKRTRPAKVLVLTAELQFRNRVQTVFDTPDWVVLPLLEEISSDEILALNADLIVVDHAIPSINVLLLIRELRLTGLNVPVIYNSSSGYSDFVCRRLEPIFLTNHIATDQTDLNDLLSIAQTLCGQPASTYSSPYLSYFDSRNAAGALIARRHRCRLGQSVDLETLSLIDKLAREYIIEMPETLKQVQVSLQDLSLPDNRAAESCVIRESLSEILNIVHQINGTGSSFGFIELGIVASLMERRLQSAIDSEHAVNTLDFDEYLGYVDLMIQMSDALTAPLSPDMVACLAAPVPPAVIALGSPLAEAENVQQSNESSVCEVLVPEPAAIRRIALVASSDSVDGKVIRTIINDPIQMSEEYQLIDAYNALSAFNLMEEFKPELLIIEARLPGLNGLEACKMIRSHPQWKEAKVLMLIDSQDKSDSVFQSGADDYLVTPTQVDSTVSKLKQLLARKINRSEQVLATKSWSID